MTELNIWFNQTYSSHFFTVESLYPAARAAGYTANIHTTSDVELSPVLRAGNVRSLEPLRSEVTGNDYVEWALQYVRENRIHVLVPMRETMALSRRRDEFAALGCALVSDSTETIELLEDKELAYLHAEKIGVPTPPWRVFSDYDGFIEGYISLLDELMNDFNVEPEICLKPMKGVGAVGFKRILTGANERITFEQVMAEGIKNTAKLSELKQTLKEVGTLEDRYMLMPWLENPEVSVDTLALNGEAKIMVPRSKRERNKAIAGPETVLPAKYSQMIVESLNMSYLSNTQTREWLGEPVYLETNARMSGGLPATMLAGVNMCWEAIRAAVEGDCLSFPTPTLRNAYTTVSTPVEVGL